MNNALLANLEQARALHRGLILHLQHSGHCAQRQLKWLVTSHRNPQIEQNKQKRILPNASQKSHSDDFFLLMPSLGKQQGHTGQKTREMEWRKEICLWKDKINFQSKKFPITIKMCFTMKVFPLQRQSFSVKNQDKNLCHSGSDLTGLLQMLCSCPHAAAKRWPYAASSHCRPLWGAETLTQMNVHGLAMTVAPGNAQNGLEATWMPHFCIICVRVEWDMSAPLHVHVQSDLCPLFYTKYLFFFLWKLLLHGVRTWQHSHST